jgi:hypothetical protein
VLDGNERNILRLIFCDPNVRAAQPDWKSAARSVVSAFRIEATRAGAQAAVTSLVDELVERSPEFAQIWHENSIMPFEGIVKRLQHPVLGPIALEHSSLGIDDRADLTMVVYTPATVRDRRALQSFLKDDEVETFYCRGLN